MKRRDGQWLQHVSSDAAVSPIKYNISLLLVICVEYSCGHFSRKEEHNKVHCYDYGRRDMRSQDEQPLEFVSTNVDVGATRHDILALLVVGEKYSGDDLIK